MNTQVSIIMHAIDEIQSFFFDEILNEFTQGYIRPAMMMTAQELSLATQQISAPIGAMIDGQVAITASLELELARGRAFKDNVPAVSMCEFASLSKSIAASDYRKDLTHNVLSKYSADRAMGVRNLSGAAGIDFAKEDQNTRFKEYLGKHCDVKGEGENVKEVYTTCAGSDERLNRDIDYTALLHSTKYNANQMHQTSSLDINLQDVTVTPDEEDIFAMSKNLYSSNLDVRPQRGLVENKDNRHVYMDFRSLRAKKSVAENSFNALVALKTKNPNSDLSYFEEMENLTKKLYQDPKFFANLYDNPANVRRQEAAMQGIGLMQLRDLYESQIRSEMLLSVLLEAKLEHIARKKEGER